MMWCIKIILKSISLGSARCIRADPKLAPSLWFREAQRVSFGPTSVKWGRAPACDARHITWSRTALTAVLMHPRDVSSWATFHCDIFCRSWWSCLLFWKLNIRVKYLFCSCSVDRRSTIHYFKFFSLKWQFLNSISPVGWTKK